MASKLSPVPVNYPTIELFCVSLPDGKFGGYKQEILKQNLTPMEQTLVVCPSCKGIMKDASFSVGKTMCQSCCPQTEEAIPVEPVRETVNKLPCGCPLDSKGCAWSGVIGELEGHLSVCQHLMVPCPFAEFGCEVGLVVRLEMQLHLKEFSYQHLVGRIMRVEEDNRSAFNEIDLLKKENRNLKEEFRLLKDSVISEKSIVKPDLRKHMEGKELVGFQFVISDVKKQTESGNITKGPIFYLKKYKIQLHFEIYPQIYIYIMRIAGEYDQELGNARVGLTNYQIISGRDSSVMFECSKDLQHPLTIGVSSFQLFCEPIPKYFSKNELTVRLFFELKM